MRKIILTMILFAIVSATVMAQYSRTFMVGNVNIIEILDVNHSSFSQIISDQAYTTTQLSNGNFSQDEEGTRTIIFPKSASYSFKCSYVSVWDRKDVKGVFWTGGTYSSVLNTIAARTNGIYYFNDFKSGMVYLIWTTNENYIMYTFFTIPNF